MRSATTTIIAIAVVAVSIVVAAWINREAQKAAMPGFAEYEVQAAPRQIPVLVLSPRR